VTGAGARRGGGRTTGAGPPGRARNGAGGRRGSHRRGQGATGEGARRGQGAAEKGCAMGVGGRQEEDRRGGEEERGRGDGRGAHLGDPNSGDHRLQDLGHHGEREREVERRLLRERIEMRERDQGARMGRAPGARGARAKLG
jgi:hypothetical protein